MPPWPAPSARPPIRSPPGPLPCASMPASWLLSRRSRPLLHLLAVAALYERRWILFRARSLAWPAQGFSDFSRRGKVVTDRRLRNCDGHRPPLHLLAVAALYERRWILFRARSLAWPAQGFCDFSRRGKVVTDRRLQNCDGH